MASWICFNVRHLLILILFAIVTILGIGDYIDLKRPDTTNRVRVYEKCLSFPTRKSPLHHLVENTFTFDEIEGIYPNENKDLDYITVLLRDGRGVPVGKVFISDLNVTLNALKTSVRIVRNVDLATSFRKWRPARTK